MNLGLTKEEAAWLLGLIELDIDSFGGMDRYKAQSFAQKLDIESIIQQLKIIEIIGDSWKETVI